ncbi:MAG TPA: hypothetical protein VF773_10405 [Verrucomicrobiae bacterium]
MGTTDDHRPVWGPYPNYDDIARFEYGRMLWRNLDFRARLLRHWLDERHPYHHRFQEQRSLIEEVLNSTETPAALDARHQPALRHPRNPACLRQLLARFKTGLEHNSGTPYVPYVPL